MKEVFSTMNTNYEVRRVLRLQNGYETNRSTSGGFKRVLPVCPSYSSMSKLKKRGYGCSYVIHVVARQDACEGFLIHYEKTY